MLSGITARMRSLWRGLRQRREMDSEMSDEFQLHIELRAADLMRTGLSPDAALKRAREEFGVPARHKEEARASRGLRRFDELRFSWLDFRLGARMLRKYPGLTIVGGMAFAFAIWTGAVGFEIATQISHPNIPLPDGARIVGLREWDVSASRTENRVLHDFALWRSELKLTENIGAQRTVKRNLITADGRSEPVDIAEMSASGFALARVPALFGRALLPSDERAGAPPVVVIGYTLWKSRFAGNRNVVGTVVRLGNTQSTVVGVMPDKFAFPVFHNVWVPLTLDAASYAPRQGPSIKVFGKLAKGASLLEAQTELETLNARITKDAPESHRNLITEVLPYAKSLYTITGEQSAILYSTNLPILLLIVLVCSNVALLMFARAATREREILVRNALGASRGRIVMQLFAEALVLGSAAAVVGLASAGFGLRSVKAILGHEFLNGNKFPFWVADSLSSTTVLYAAILTVVGAIISGVLPALKVTRNIDTRLRRSSAGGGGLQFGGIWTVVIVSQVAVTVAFPAIAFFMRRDILQMDAVEVGFPAKEYLTARLEIDRDTDAKSGVDTSVAGFRALYEKRYQLLRRALLSDPAVAGVTFANRLPRMYHPHRLVEVDGDGAAPFDARWPAYRVSDASVDAEFFNTIGTPILSGRNFSALDDKPGQQVVIVNQSFVRIVLGNRNAIGRRVRYLYYEESGRAYDGDTKPGPWLEIVGVVPDMGMATEADPKHAGIYLPATAGGSLPVQIAVHLKDGSEPIQFINQVRTLATSVDPALRLYNFMRLDGVNDGERNTLVFALQLLTAVSAIALLLSLAGIYSVMAFTVSRRTREIGVRVALGANPTSVVGAIFKRPLIHVSIGIGAGAALTTLLSYSVYGASLSVAQIGLVLGYATLMLGVCTLACIVPSRRALAVQPTEALRADS